MLSLSLPLDAARARQRGRLRLLFVGVGLGVVLAVAFGALAASDYWVQCAPGASANAGGPGQISYYSCQPGA